MLGVSGAAEMPRRGSRDGFSQYEPNIMKVKREFVRRVSRIMKKRGMSDSGLALAMYGTAPDSTGRMAPARRDYISRWMNRNVQTMPRDENVKLMAEALGVEPDEIDPAKIKIATDNPPIDVRYDPRNIKEAWITINMRVSARTAAELQNTINNDPVAQRMRQHEDADGLGGGDDLEEESEDGPEAS